MAYTSIVDYLKSVGKPSDFASRTTLATQSGIQNYTGTAEQNVKLLGLLQQPAPQPVQPIAPFPIQLVPPVVPPQPQLQPQPQPQQQPTAGQQFIQQPTAPPVAPIGPVQPQIQPPAQATPPISPTPQVQPPSAQPQQPAPAPQPQQPQVQYTPPQTTNANNQVYKTWNTKGNNWDVFNADGSKIELADFQSRGLNIDHINTKEDIIKQSGVQPGAEGQPEAEGQEAPKEQMSPMQWSDFFSAALTESGALSAKAEIEKANKAYADIANELADAIMEVNSNPWLAEGLRAKKVSLLQEKYQSKLDTVTNQLKLYNSLYQEAVEMAKFNTQTAQGQYQFDVNTQLKLTQMAQDKAEATAKLLEVNPARFKGVQGGLYDVEEDKWVVPPKVTGTDTDKNVPDYNKNPVLTTTQEYTLQARGVTPEIYNLITQAILGGSTLEEIRQALRADRLDPKVLDTYDQVVGIAKLLGQEKTTTSGSKLDIISKLLED